MAKEAPPETGQNAAKNGPGNWPKMGQEMGQKWAKKLAKNWRGAFCHGRKKHDFSRIEGVDRF